jgi:hypothetical protein
MNTDEIVARLEQLRAEHRALDAALASDPQADQLEVARRKKRKLRLKDEIAMLEDALLPDLIA